MKITLLLITLGIGTTILTGISYLRKGKKTTKSGLKKAIAINVVSILALFLMGLVPDIAFAAETTQSTSSSASGMGYLAAALSTGLAAIGTGIGVGQAGSAAIGAVSEDSSILGKTLIIVIIEDTFTLTYFFNKTVFKTITINEI